MKGIRPNDAAHNLFLCNIKYRNKKYNLLTIKSVIESKKTDNTKYKNHIRLAICECDCGNKKTIYLREVVGGGTKSCGCIHTKHGRKNTTEYRIWTGIKNRCYNKNHHAYHNYGGRGVVMDESWRDNFKIFFDYIGHRQSPNVTLDRINNDGNYEPGNVKWSTKKEQGRNTRFNRIISFNGETHCLAEWADILNIGRVTLSRRIDKYGWSIEKSLTTKINNK